MSDVLSWIAAPDRSAGSAPSAVGRVDVPVAGAPTVDHLVAAWAVLLNHHTGVDVVPIVRADGEQPEVVELALHPDALCRDVVDAAAAGRPVRESDWESLPAVVVGPRVRPPGCAPWLVLTAGDVPTVALEFDPVRHDPAAMSRHAQHLAATVALVVEGSTAVGAVDPLSAQERAQILGSWNSTRRDYPRDARIEHLVLGHADRAPDAVAVVDGATRLTYGQLADASGRLAVDLRAAGARPGDVVALFLPRGASLVVAALAVLRAGATYLPVDPEYPDARVAYMLRDSAAAVVVAAAGERSRIPADLGGVPVVDPDAPPAWSGEPDVLADAGAAAYLMYTSGTTGEPKGVLIPHRGVVRLVVGSSYVELGAGTVMAHIGATGFDASVFEMWGALVNGGTLVVLDRATVIDAVELRAALAEHGITSGLVTSALFAHLADEDPTLFAPMTDLVVGGDVLSAAHARAVLAANPGLRLVNAYGPTENSVISTTHRVSPSSGSRVPIGRPIANSTALVLGPDRRLVPVGVPGELHVGGDGLALGYHRRPDATQAAFVEHPFVAGERLYRTGDRVVLRHDGSIDFRGRLDEQVKIRGFRVEPAEVEQVMCGIEGVEEAVVVVRRRRGSSDSELCAYVTGSRDLQEGPLRALVRTVLPEHMVPTSVVVLDRLPLTAHGKVDRAALPEPGRVLVVAVDLSTDEERMASLWREVLGVPVVGPHDTLRDLGGSSLSATRIAGLVRSRLGWSCPVAAVLGGGSLRELVASLPREGGQQGPTAGSGALVGPLSPQQRAVHAELTAAPGSLDYNLPVVVDVGARDLDLDLLTSTWETLVGRHEVLRTSFRTDSSGAPVQEVGASCRVHLETVALDAWADLDGWARTWVRPFDLGRAPLWRLAVVRAPGRSAIVLDVHHLVTDGFSLRLLMEEWSALLDGVDVLAPPLRYRDFAAWSAVPGRAVSDAGGTTQPPPDLPVDRPRPPLRSTAGRYLSFSLGDPRSRRVRACARDLGVSPFVVLLSAYATFLGRVTGADDVTVAVPFSGRNVPHTERVQGMFVTTAAVPLHPAPTTTFRQLVVSTAQASVAAMDGGLAAAGRAVGRDRHPLADTLFALQDTGLAQVQLLGGRPRWRPELTGSTIFDLNLQVDDDGETFEAVWGYSTALFDRASVESFRDDLLAVVDAATVDPDVPLQSLAARAAPRQSVSLSFDL
ncbi:amino acid adenylation domain-containing protein [Cellulomonas sp. P5_C5]